MIIYRFLDITLISEMRTMLNSLKVEFYRLKNIETYTWPERISCHNVAQLITPTILLVLPR